ncbi:MAG: MFS transporter [Ideonella sp.]|nr:MFS transporter [Ideonella sp.]MCC7458441.1 MFS transporter [Nitrospira sp.]
MSPLSPARRSIVEPALVVILAGVGAALHVGKLPPAIPALQQALGLTLLQAAFLLSMVQGAGMLAGVAFGALADALGLRRSMLLGLSLLAIASVLGGLSQHVALLLALRGVEGFGFLLTVLPAPGLVRRLVPPQRVSLMLGVWGAYMPLATASALLVGPLWIDAFGWRSWWWLLAVLSALAALRLAHAVPAGATAAANDGAAPVVLPWHARLAQTLSTRGPWWLAISFAMYSGQWLAVIGFLPAIYTQAGIGGAATGALTALAAAVNMVGNIGSGRLLHKGARPTTLLSVGFVAMALAAVVAFAGADGGAHAALRYVAVLAFSLIGGMIPATLFALAMRVAPSDQTLSTTVGWMQQWSAFGQFIGPPLVAWVAGRAGGWQFTWVVTGACSLVGLGLAAAIARLRLR